LKEIYIAGPLFSEYERRFLEDLTNNLSKRLNLDREKFFLPHFDAKDIGPAGARRKEVFSADLNALDEIKLIIAWLDGPDVDSGTALELGYGYAKKKEIFGLLTDFRHWDDSHIFEVNNMIWGVCKEGRRIYRTEDSLISDVKKTLNMTDRTIN
jgi:nucleoside 2-deoxyribosyltransferase